MTDDPLEQVRSQHRYEVENTYSDEEDDKKVDAINGFLDENDRFRNELLSVYQDAVAGGDQVATLKLYQVTVDLNNVLVNRLKDSDEEELAEKLEAERNEMVGLVAPNRISEAIESSERLTFANRRVKSVIRKNGTKIRSYCFWLLSGTQITNESSGRGF